MTTLAFDDAPRTLTASPVELPKAVRPATPVKATNKK